MDGEIRIKGEDPIRINRRFAGPQASAFASSAAAVPLAALLKADFDGMDITGITLNMTAADGSKTGVVDRIAIDKTRVRAGDTIEITAHTRTESGKVIAQKIPVTIPSDTAPGQLSIMIGDGSAVQQNAAANQFTPRTAAELIATINRLKRSDRLYVVITRTSTGAIIGATELPNLPPSVLATMYNDRTAGGSKPAVNSVVAEMELPAGEFIVSGSQILSIEIVR